MSGKELEGPKRLESLPVLVAIQFLLSPISYFAIQWLGEKMKDQKFVQNIQGKILEEIVVGNEDDDLFVDIRFQDATSCFIHVQPAQIRLNSVTVLGWKDGNSRLIRKLL